MMNALIQLTQQLINQPSITPNDYNCQNIITDYLKSLQFTVEPMHFNDTCNIWSYRNGYIKNNPKKNTLLFLGHTDVVPPGNLKDWMYPPFSGIVSNGFLYGRGASDMKGALAAMLVATKIFIQKNPNHSGRIAFIITSDEEGSGANGTTKIVQNLINKKETINYCIIGEPTSKKKLGDTIKNGRRGSITGTLIIPGIPGHVAYPQYLKNPIHLSIPVISQLLNTKWDQKKSVTLPETSIQIIDICTNATPKSNNITPDQLKIKFNFRFNDISSIHNIQNNIKKILTKYQLNYYINWGPIAEPYFSKIGSLTNSVIDTIKYCQNIIPALETTGGTSDGRFIIKMGAEIIELGALNNTIHKTNECIKLTDLHILSHIYLKIMQKILL